VAEFDQAPGVAAGSVGRVQSCSWCHPLEDRPHHGLLELDQRVAGVVVGLRPTGIAMLSVDDRHVDSEPVDLVATANDASDLLHPCCR
jgi:hypothetical protein